MSKEQLLDDAELLENGRPTYAALVLLGTRKALGRHLADAEVVFEWRLKEGAIKADKRQEFRKGFFLYFDELWKTINLRNQVHQYQDGLFRYEVPVFREDVVREAILNAISHRDYRTVGSVFIRQWPTRMEVVSPGGFPDGITIENLVRKTKPRNRRIAETLARCGFVERSGQGADMMYSWSIRDGKALPDFSNSDPYEVFLNLDGSVKDEHFIKFLERLGREKQISWGLDELWALSCIQTKGNVPNDLRFSLQRLEKLGAIERVGGRKLVLSRRYYALAKRKGEYTRKRGLDNETNKALLLKHIKDNASTGSTASEFQQVLPSLNRNQISFLLRILKDEKLIHMIGKNRGAKWYPGPEAGD
jgi:ATP-dependent DNA helicase RecG